MPGSEGLELLIRKGGASGGMELRTLDSSQVFLRLRPRRAPGVEVEENVVEEVTGTVHLLKRPGGDRVLRATPRQHHVWQQLDGRRTIAEIAADWFARFGSFDFEEIRAFLTSARRLGLVEFVAEPRGLLRVRRMVPSGRLARLLQRLGSVDLRWEGADARFAALARRVGWLFSRALAPVHVLVALAGLVVWGLHRFGDRFGAAALPAWAWLAAVAALAPGLLLVHEVAHGVATRRIGRRVKAAGFTFVDRFVPTFYVDVTDTWMASRGERVAVVLAGPLANAVLAALFAFAALAAPSPGASWALMVAADASLLLVAYTAWPFTGLPEDGYLALGDGARVADLRRRAARLVRHRLLGGEPPPPEPAARPYVLAYAAGVALTWALLASLGVWLLAGWLAGPTPA